MTAREQHPPEEKWWQWVVRGSDLDTDLGKHVQECEHCRDVVEAFELLVRAGRSRRWALPSSSIYRRALRIKEDPAPSEAESAQALDWTLAEVRGSAMAEETESRVASGSLPGIQVSLVAAPRAADLMWTIRGKLWSDSPSSVSRVLLVHDDHVLAQSILIGSGEFAFEEAVAKGWSIEIHGAPGETLILHGPKGE